MADDDKYRLDKFGAISLKTFDDEATTVAPVSVTLAKVKSFLLNLSDLSVVASRMFYHP